MIRKLTGMVLVTLLASCGQKGLTREEAAEALDEVEIATQAQALTAGTVEITTNFKIGDAVEAAAEELRSFYASQLACAEVELTGNTLTVEYGANGVCLYRGQKYTGTHSVTISRNEEAEVIVDHVWEDLQNDHVKVNGTASVTWNFRDPSRHVQHNLEWTRLKDGRTGVGTGDRIQKPLEGGLLEGISIDGHRTWDGESGHWDLAINNVEVRWIDPVPQSGSYVLDTPFDRSLSLAFERLDSTTIQVTVSGPKNSFDFKVKSLPAE